MATNQKYYFIESPNKYSGYTAMEKELGEYASKKLDRAVVSEGWLKSFLDTLEERQIGNTLNHKRWTPVRIGLFTPETSSCAFLCIGEYTLTCKIVADIRSF